MNFFLTQIKACIWARLLFGYIEIILSLSVKSAKVQIQAAASKRWNTVAKKNKFSSIRNGSFRMEKIINFVVFKNVMPTFPSPTPPKALKKKFPYNKSKKVKNFSFWKKFNAKLTRCEIWCWIFLCEKLSSGEGPLNIEGVQIEIK